MNVCLIHIFSPESDLFFFFVSAGFFFCVLALGSKQPTKLCIVTMEKQELFPSFSFKPKKKKKNCFLSG